MSKHESVDLNDQQRVCGVFFSQVDGGGGLFFVLSSLTALNSRLGSLVVTASFTFNFVD